MWSIRTTAWLGPSAVASSPSPSLSFAAARLISSSSAARADKSESSCANSDRHSWPSHPRVACSTVRAAAYNSSLFKISAMAVRDRRVAESSRLGGSLEGYSFGSDAFMVTLPRAALAPPSSLDGTAMVSDTRSGGSASMESTAAAASPDASHASTTAVSADATSGLHTSKDEPASPPASSPYIAAMHSHSISRRWRSSTAVSAPSAPADMGAGDAEGTRLAPPQSGHPRHGNRVEARSNFQGVAVGDARSSGGWRDRSPPVRSARARQDTRPA